MSGLIVTAVLVIIALAPFLRGRFDFVAYWSKGIVPPNLKYTSENLILMYIGLSGLLIGKHPVEAHKKLNFLYKFIIKNMGEEGELLHINSDYYQELKGSVIYAKKHPIKLSSASDWFNRHRISAENKLRLIQFLADLAYVDQQMHPAELKVIITLAEQMKIPVQKVNAIIDPLKEEQEARARREQEQWKSRTQTKAGSSYQKNKYCAVMGIEATASKGDLKKAYRKLVLAHHPDKFVNAPPAEYDAAQKKFIEIQTAYEALEKSLQ